jgi:hypothetical protein
MPETPAPPRRHIPPVVANRLEIRAGAVRMVRRGPLQMVDQKRGFAAARAPERHGLWAFPHPYFDDWYAQHKWDEVLPKRLRSSAIVELGKQGLDTEPLWQAREQWIREHRSLMPLRHFWWEGDIWARFDARGKVAGGWFLLDHDRYVDAARRVEPGITYSHDHMEVFLAEGRGRIRGRL